MESLLAEKRDIEFVLYEQLNILGLTQREKFDYFSREDFEMILEQAYKFAENELAPVNREGDRVGAVWKDGKVILPESFKQPLEIFGNQGWVSAVDDPEYGGQGLPLSVFTACNEIFHAANSSLNLYPGLAHGAGRLIEMYGTDEQKSKYVENLYSFRWGGTMCLTEPGAGSDLAHVSTKAVKVDDRSYKITGQKIFVTGGDFDAKETIIHMVLARIEGDPQGIKGISIFIVPRNKISDSGGVKENNDVACAGIEHKMGIKGSSTCQLSFGDNNECIGELLGEPGQGIPIMFNMMNEERLNVGVQALGTASTAYLNALNYSIERLQGTDIRLKGKSLELVPIISHPEIRRSLLWIKSHVEGLRAMSYYAAYCLDLRNSAKTEEDRKAYNGFLELLTPVCKAYTSEKAFEICSQSLQVLGGYGYCGDYPMEQFARDCRITSIYEGTNGIQAMDLLGRKLNMAGGMVFEYLIQEMKKTVQEAKKSASLQKYAMPVDSAKESAAKAAGYLSDLMQTNNVPQAYLSATPFLEILGDAIMGWMHLWQLSIASAKLESFFEETGAISDEDKAALISDNKEVAFYSGKVYSARYFISKILPLQKAKAESILDRDISALEIDARGFGGLVFDAWS